MKSSADLLTTREVQDALHVNRTTIYRMVDSGDLPALRVGKQWRFVRAEFERWLNARVGGVMPTAPGSSLPPHDHEAAAGLDFEHAALADLLPMPGTQMIADAFADALGVTLVVCDMQGRPMTQVCNPCGLYAAVLHDMDAVSRCIWDWQRVAGLIPIEPRFSPNDLGLLCARGLIRVGNELRGMVFVGGIAPDQWPPAPAQIAAMAEHFGVPVTVLQDHIGETHCLDRRARERVLSFVQRIADIISLMLEDRSVLAGRLPASKEATS